MTAQPDDLDPLRPLKDLHAGIGSVVDELAGAESHEERRCKAGPLLLALADLLDGPERDYARACAPRLVPDRADAITPLALSWVTGPGGVSDLDVTWP